MRASSIQISKYVFLILLASAAELSWNYASHSIGHTTSLQGRRLRRIDVENT